MSAVDDTQTRPVREAWAGLRTRPIERRTNLSACEMLQRHLMDGGRPVVLTEALEEWPALSRWSFEFFRERYGADEVHLSDCINCPTVERVVSLESYLEYIASPDGHPLTALGSRYPLYAYAYKPFLQHSELLDDYQPPDCLEDWLDHLSPAMREGYNQGWILLSPAGARSNLHVDLLGTHAWLAQIVGRKSCVLISPDDTPYVYDGQVDPLEPDLDRFPRFVQATLWYADLNPGEMLVIPSRWWHHVLTVDNSITLSHNIINSANFGAFMDEIYRGIPRLAEGLSRPASQLRKKLGIKWISRGFEDPMAPQTPETTVSRHEPPTVSAVAPSKSDNPCRIPLVTIEEHHEAFTLWEHAVQQGWIPGEGNALLHVDEHADLAVPSLRTDVKTLPCNLAAVDAFTQSELDIGSFLVPMIYRGRFGSLHWLCRERPKQLSRYWKGILFTHPQSTGSPQIAAAFRKSSEWNLLFRPGCKWADLVQFTLNDTAPLPDAAPVILDIDLDYFSCNEIPQGLPFDLEITESQYSAIMEERYHPLRILSGQNLQPVEQRGRFYLVSQVGEPATSRLRVNEDEIVRRVERFIEYLRTNCIRPALIDICRSRISGYTPADQCDFIENQVLDGLSTLYAFDAMHISDVLCRNSSPARSSKAATAAT